MVLRATGVCFFRYVMRYMMSFLELACVLHVVSICNLFARKLNFAKALMSLLKYMLPSTYCVFVICVRNVGNMISICANTE